MSLSPAAPASMPVSGVEDHATPAAPPPGSASDLSRSGLATLAALSALVALLIAQVGGEALFGVAAPVYVVKAASLAIGLGLLAWLHARAAPMAVAARQAVGVYLMGMAGCLAGLLALQGARLELGAALFLGAVIVALLAWRRGTTVRDGTVRDGTTPDAHPAPVGSDRP